MPSQAQPGDVTEAPAPPETGVMAEVSSALANSRALASNVLDLLSLEARRAAFALVWMIAGAVAGAICLVTAWLGLMAACVMAAITLGLLPVAAAMLVAGVNLLAGVGLLYACRRTGRNLLFAATRRQIAGTASLPVPSP